MLFNFVFLSLTLCFSNLSVFRICLVNLTDFGQTGFDNSTVNVAILRSLLFILGDFKVSSAL
jgi:hypothetical protein